MADPQLLGDAAQTPSLGPQPLHGGSALLDCQRLADGFCRRRRRLAVLAAEWLEHHGKR